MSVATALSVVDGMPPADYHATPGAFIEVEGPTCPRPQWLEARRAGIGSSDIAALLGLSPYESRFALWHRKRGTLGEQDETDRMAWGRQVEAAIAADFAARHPGLYVEPAGLCRSLTRPWQQCTPDRLLYDVIPVDVDGDPEPGSRQLWPVGALECKSDHNPDAWGEPGGADVPVHYRAQTIWQADTLGLPGVHLSATIAGKPPVDYWVPRDPDDAEFMRQQAEAFMADVAAGTPPPLDGSEVTRRALRQLHPSVEDVEVIVPRLLARQYRAACAALKRAEERKREAENRIRGALGGGRVAVTRDGAKVATRTVYEVKEHTRKASVVDRLTPAKETQ